MAAPPGLSQEQWQQVLAVLSNTKSSTDDRSWLLDTGASNHVTGNLALLSHVTNISPCPIGLPDGRQSSSTKQGQVQLSRHLVLNNVLYEPGLNCNLISVTHLIDDMHCVLQFTKQLCVIQDPSTRTLIGAGERRDDLYYFRTVPDVRVVTAGGVATAEL